MTDHCATVAAMEIGPTNRDRRRKPSDGATLRDLAKRYTDGASIRQLATYTGWSYATVHARIRLAAIDGLLTMRPRGGLTREQRQQRRERRDSGR